MSRSLPHYLLICNLYSFHPAAFVEKVSLQKPENTRGGSIANIFRRGQGWGFGNMNIFLSLFSWPLQVDERVPQGDVQAAYSQPQHCSPKSSFLQQRCVFCCYIRGVYFPIYCVSHTSGPQDCSLKSPFQQQGCLFLHILCSPLFTAPSLSHFKGFDR